MCQRQIVSMQGVRKRNYCNCANLVCLNQGVHPMRLCPFLCPAPNRTELYSRALARRKPCNHSTVQLKPSVAHSVQVVDFYLLSPFKAWVDGSSPSALTISFSGLGQVITADFSESYKNSHKLGKLGLVGSAPTMMHFSTGISEFATP